MLFKALKRMIERGQTEGMGEKLNIFFIANKITEEQYLELTKMIAPEENIKE